MGGGLSDNEEENECSAYTGANRTEASFDFDHSVNVDSTADSTPSIAVHYHNPVSLLSNATYSSASTSSSSSGSSYATLNSFDERSDPSFLFSDNSNASFVGNSTSNATVSTFEQFIQPVLDTEIDEFVRSVMSTTSSSTRSVESQVVDASSLSVAKRVGRPRMTDEEKAASATARAAKRYRKE